MSSVAKAVGGTVLLGIGLLVGGLFLDDVMGGGEQEMSPETRRKLENAERVQGQYRALKTAMDSAWKVWRRRAERDSAAIDSLEARVDSATAEAERADSAFDVSARSLRGNLLAVRGMVKGQRVQALVDSALADLDSLEEQERREDHAEAREDSAQRAKADSLRSQLRRAEAIARNCKRTVEKCQATVDSLSGASESLQRDLDPGLLSEVWGALPEVASKGGALILACTLPPDAEARVAGCAGAGSIIAVDLIL